MCLLVEVDCRANKLKLEKIKRKKKIYNNDWLRGIAMWSAEDITRVKVQEPPVGRTKSKKRKNMHEG